MACACTGLVLCQRKMDTDQTCSVGPTISEDRGQKGHVYGLVCQAVSERLSRQLNLFFGAEPGRYKKLCVFGYEFCNSFIFRLRLHVLRPKVFLSGLAFSRMPRFYGRSCSWVWAKMRSSSLLD